MVTDVLIDVPSLSNSKEHNGKPLLPWFCNEKPATCVPMGSVCVSHFQCHCLRV